MESNRNIINDHPYALQLFCCKHCLKEFRNKYTFARHVQRDHDGQKTFHLCNVCNKIFPTKAKLHCHSVVNHKKKAKFYCKICQTYWINKDMFLAHISTHAGEKRLYKCVECDRKYKTIGKFKVHRALHFEKKLQGECKVCLKTFSNAKLLRMHKCEKAVTSLVLSSLVPVLQNNKTMVIAIYEPCIEKQGNESLVNQQPNNSIDLDKLNSRNYQFSLIQPKPGVPGSYQYKPLKSHASKTFQCKVCGKFFLGRSVLSKHLKDSAMCAAAKHQNIMPVETHRCEVCGKYFSSAGLLKQHQENKHKPTEQPNSSIDLSKLNGKNNELKPILPKNDLPVIYENKSEPLKAPAPKNFQCKVCEKFFPDKSVLHKDSMKSIRKPKNICKTCDKKHSTATCEKCGQTFVSMKIYRNHMLRSKSCGRRNFSCEKCKEVFSRQEALTQHLVNPVYCHAYVKGQPFECDYCGRTFDKRGSFKLHMDTHVKDRNHVCVGCGRKFVHIGHLTQHYSINVKCREGEEYEKYLESIKPGIEYKCKECGRCDFKNAATFHSHRQSHIKDVVCKKCGAKFLRPDSLRQHERESCMGDHVCQFCGKKGFRNRLQLSAHLKEHDPSFGLNHALITDSKPFKCEKCNMTFTRQLTLLQHQRLHCPGGLMCHFCAKADFRDKRQFQKHMTDHDPSFSMETENFNVKSYLSRKHFCKVCVTAFDSNYSKEKHMRKVHGEKFLCRICGAVLATPKSLSDHEQHVHAAKVACDVCGKAVRAENMILHKRKHTGETPYDCKTCGKKFKSRASILYHTKVQKCGI